MKCFAAYLVVFLAILISCDSQQEILEKKIRNIPVKFALKRFELDFENPDNLPRAKAMYPYLFPKQYADSVWQNILKDTLQIALRKEVKKTFPSLKEQKKELELLFKHVKYYFPRKKIPTVVTLVSEVDYNNKIIYADSLMLIALDTYLGTKHRFYIDLYDYIKQNMNPSQIAVDAAEVLVSSETPYPRTNSFLSVILYEGKKLYLKDLLLAETPDNHKIGYTEAQMDWALKNESYVWSYFVENRLLFSTDRKLLDRFVNPAPFSKFYREIDNLSSPRVGTYIGWHIVRAFMENNAEVNWKTMLSMPDEDLFKKSYYKPKK